MKHFYLSGKHVLLSLSLMSSAFFSLKANAQTSCTAVQTLNENFDTMTAFPEKCWTGNFPTYPTTSLTTGTNKGLQLYSGMVNNADIIVVAPEVSTINGKYALSFDIVSISQPGTTIQIGTMTDNTNFTTFSPVGTPFTPVAGSTHQTAVIPANSGHKYVAVKFIHGGGHKALVLDNFEWKAPTAGTIKFDIDKVKIYPNPTTGLFYIATEIDVKEIEVYNTLGQKVVKTQQKEINLENAASGIYIVNVYAKNGTQASYKLIKK